MGKFKENIKKGFTLAELLIVVAIIAVLVAISIPIFSSQLEKSRRAVDMANARNIIDALSTSMNDGSIEFGSSTYEGKPTCVVVAVGEDSMKVFASGSIKVNSETWDTTGQGHARIKALLEADGISNYTIHAKDTNNNGWKFYAVFLYSDGTIRIGSGTDDGFDHYREDTFEDHAKYWKKSDYSNIEKAMGLAK